MAERLRAFGPALGVLAFDEPADGPAEESGESAWAIAVATVEPRPKMPAAATPTQSCLVRFTRNHPIPQDPLDASSFAYFTMARSKVGKNDAAAAWTGYEFRSARKSVIAASTAVNTRWAASRSESGISSRARWVWVASGVKNARPTSMPWSA